MKREDTRGGYMGDIITPANRRRYVYDQARAYKEQYLRTTAEEKRIPEDQLDQEADGYGRYRANRENKHHQAYLKGRTTYKYKGQLFPVMTGQFVKEARTAQQIIDLHKVEEKN